MTKKIELITGLRSVYEGWHDLLSQMSEDEIAQPRFADNWSIRDFVTHLWAWQQISAARCAAALAGTEPHYPGWLDGTDPFVAEEHTGQFNARVRAGNLDRPWADVYVEWRANFLNFMALVEQIPEEVLFEEGRYAWLQGYPLADVLSGSLGHHREHLEEVAAALA